MPDFTLTWNCLVKFFFFTVFGQTPFLQLRTESFRVIRPNLLEVRARTDPESRTHGFLKNHFFQNAQPSQKAITQFWDVEDINN